MVRETEREGWGGGGVGGMGEGDLKRRKNESSLKLFLRRKNPGLNQLFQIHSYENG